MLDSSALDQLAETFHGTIVTPGDPSFDGTRAVWNGMIDRRPALIARCIDVADVVTAVNFARDHDLTVSVRGGGHNVAGSAICDNGMMIDLSRMKDVQVNVENHTARVGGGAKLGDLDAATGPFGLAASGGVVSDTGVAGLTLGGGIGYLSRRFGLASDNLIEAELVTADGQVLTANDTENSDLYWALRGGGGNFGVVTSFTFQLHQVGPEVLAARIFFPIEACGDVLRAYRKLMANAPDELACYALGMVVPPVQPFAEEFHGKTSIMILACYTGPHEEGQALLEPLRKVARPILAGIAPEPYVELQKSLDAGVPVGGRYYWKSQNIDEISDELIETFVERIDPIPGPNSIVGFEALGGAINRVESGASAYADRSSAFAIGIWSGWTDTKDDDRIVGWTREFHQALTPYSSGGVYSNYLDQDDSARVGDAYGANYKRLQQIKAKYDPTNFFRMNHNIEPAR